MARPPTKAATSKSDPPARVPLLDRAGRRVRCGLFWIGAVCLIAVTVAVVANRHIDPGRTFYMNQEARRLGGIAHQWVALDMVAPVMARSVVAAEDANFCLHWGFDMGAIRAVIEAGGARGASTLSQQTVKNVYLWQGRSWPRKALEAAMTPLVEVVWPKQRIIEIYLNVAEFDEGVFGVDAAARHYFSVGPEALTPTQAARLAAVLPDPKNRSASKPTAWLKRRAAAIMDGAATIRRDGRSGCFED